MCGSRRCHTISDIFKCQVRNILGLQKRSQLFVKKLLTVRVIAQESVVLKMVSEIAGPRNKVYLFEFWSLPILRIKMICAVVYIFFVFNHLLKFFSLSVQEAVNIDPAIIAIVITVIVQAAAKNWVILKRIRVFIYRFFYQ